LRLTLRHYYDFGTDKSVVGTDLATPEAWDGLRTRTSGAFSIPASRAEFTRVAGGHHDVAARAREIDAWLEKRGAATVASYGAGGAVLEWWLATLRPDRKLTVTDYGEATVERLAEVFPEAEVRYHDLRQDTPVPADVHLFHRIETELGDDEWRDVFRRFEHAHILFVAAGFLDLRGLLSELRNRPLLKGRRATKAGFIRTRAAVEALWSPTHSAEPLRVHDLDAWALAPCPGEAAT
jgi:hypothetical protein